MSTTLPTQGPTSHPVCTKADMRQFEYEHWNSEGFQTSGYQHLGDEAQLPTVTFSSLRSPQTSGPSTRGFTGFKEKKKSFSTTQWYTGGTQIQHAEEN